MEKHGVSGIREQRNLNEEPDGHEKDVEFAATLKNRNRFSGCYWFQ